MSVPLDLVRADFDRIGTLSAGRPLDRSNRIALSKLRPGARSILEVGCGTGALSEHLAVQTDRLVAIDASPVMARTTAKRCPRAEVIETDLACFHPTQRFDAVVTVATLHHMDLDVGLSLLASFVAPGGQLVIVDLFDAGHSAYSAFNVVLRMLHRDHHGGAELAAAWAEHGLHEHMPKLSAVRAACRRVLPAAQIRKHLEWRYSIVA